MTTAPSWPIATEQVARLERLITRHEVLVNAKTVTWRRLGQGEPLILIHGGHGSWLHWVRNLEYLARYHEVWVPDLPGYGDSDSPDDWGLDSLVDATCNSLDVLLGPQTPVRLIGFSFGGLVAATLATRRSAVIQLALLGPGGHGGIRRPRGELQTWNGLSPDSQAWLNAMKHNLRMHMLHEASSIGDLALQVHGQSCLNARFYSKKISRAGGLGQVLDAYSGPVLLVWGEHDVTADPTTIGTQLTDRQPQRESVVIQGAGHWVQFEMADRINALIHQWMK